MANYYGNTRTNYFRVIDEKEFINIVESKMRAYEDTIEYWTKQSNNETYYAFGVYDEILGVCECEYCKNIENRVEEDEDDELECDAEYSYDKMCELLQKVVHPEDAIIITSTGHEKLRYIIGNSTIITNTQIKHIDLWDEASKQAKLMLNNDNYEFDCCY
ncbi:MAG: hypothetical protein IJH34_12535 [Romboutsia sp.]|nr:hypothetical protein [Romboutsia sp.]